jgi:hypothetical protein
MTARREKTMRERMMRKRMMRERISNIMARGAGGRQNLKGIK